jgi:peptidoglycan/LPS O-acetylase OafA/YrhL
LRGTYNAGNIAVLVFFAISGFLICRSYICSPGPRRFLDHRIRRIYPGYLAATLIACFVVIPLYSSRSLSSLTGAELSKIFGLNLLLQNYTPTSDTFGDGVINGSLWSIPFEFWCYLGIAGLGLARLLSNRGLLALALVLIIAMRVAFDAAGWFPSGKLLGAIFGPPVIWFTVLPYFLCGMLLYLFRAEVQRNLWLLCAGIALLLAAAILPPDPVYRRIATDIVFPPVISYAVIYAAFLDLPLLRASTQWGDFSYGTYLYAYPIQRMLVFSLKDVIPFAIYVPLAMILTLGAGIVSWLLIERRFLHRKKGRASATEILERQDDHGRDAPLKIEKPTAPVSTLSASP